MSVSRMHTQQQSSRLFAVGLLGYSVVVLLIALLGRDALSSHATFGLGEVLPSLRPISLSCWRSRASSSRTAFPSAPSALASATTKT